MNGSPRITFDDRVALVTGAGRGLGRAYALLLASRGASVVVHDAGLDLEGAGGDQSVAASVVDQIRSAGGRAEAATEDLVARGACERLVQMAIERFGRLDVLISNAGLRPLAGLEDVTDEALGRMIAVGVEAPFRLCRAAFPHMKRERYGRIVLTTSGRAIYVDGAMPGLSTYAVGKAAQLGLMVSLAAEGEPFGIRVNAVSPVADTRMTIRRDPRGPLAAEQVAPGVAFLASSACDFSGVILRAAGGRFSVARWAFTDEVRLGPGQPGPEAIAERWEEIARGPVHLDRPPPAR